MTARERLFFALMLGLVVGLDPLSIDTALPAAREMAAGLGTDLSSVQLSLSLFVFGMAVGQPVYGPLSDRFGRRPVLLGALALYVAATAALAIAPGIGMLVAARLVQGLAAAATQVISRAIVRDRLDREAASRVLSHVFLVLGITPIVAPVLGAWLTETAGWRSVFLVMLAYGAAALLVHWRWLPETNAAPDRDALAPGRLIAAFSGVAGNGLFWAYVGCGAAVFAALFAFLAGAPAAFIVHLGATPGDFGWFFALVMVGNLAGYPVGARLVVRLGINRLLMWGTLGGLASGLAIAGLAVAGVASPWAVVLPALAYMFCFALVLPPATAGALSPFPRVAGAASSLLGVAQLGAGAVAGAIVAGLDDGTQMPLAIGMAAASVAGLVAFACVRGLAAGGRALARVQRDADRLFVRAALAPQRLQRLLGGLQREFVGVQPLQPVPVLRQHAERLDIGVASLGVDPLEDELLVDHRLHVERDGLVLRLDAAQHHRPAGPGGGDRVLDRGRRPRHHVERDIDAAPAGDRHHPLDHVLAVGLDGEIGAERLGEAELVGAARGPGDDDRGRAGLARGDHGAEAALAVAEDQHGIAQTGRRHLHRPADAGGDRLVEQRQRERHGLRQPVQHGALVQVDVLAVAAPQPVPHVARRVAVAGRRAGRHQRAAVVVVAAEAERAAPAGEMGLQRHPVAHRHPPRPRRLGADLGDAPDRLVARDDGVAHDALGGEIAAILLDIGAAEPAGLDPQQRLPGPDRRHLVFVGLDAAVRDLDHDPGFHPPPARRPRRDYRLAAGPTTKHNPAMEPVSLPRLSLAERDRRHAAVRAAMAESGLDCIVAPQNTGEWDACQPDVRYLTTIGGGGTAAAAVFPAKGEPTAIVREPRRVAFWRAAQDWIGDVRATREGRWGEAMADAIGDRCGARARVGIAGLEGVLRFPDGTMAAGELRALHRAFPEIEFVDATALMHDIRQVKSAEEIALIERAQVCADAIGEAVFAHARAGTSEHDLYAEMMAAHIRSGGEAPAMILVGIGKAPSQTFLMPTFRALEAGDIVICESEIKYAGYMAQSIEAVSLGPPGDDYRRLFEASLSCFEMLLAAIRPGVAYAELIRLWGAHMEKAGLRAAPTMGHGVGLGQDGPTTRPGGDAQGRTVEAGHCLILKPWAMSADGERALRAGNTVVVGETGARRLGRLPMAFRAL